MIRVKERTMAHESKTWFSVKAAAGNKRPEVVIYDEIGMWGISATDFMRALRSLGDIAGKDADLRLHTPGGDCFVGNAIFNMLRDSGAKWSVYVDGLAASMGSLIATIGPVTMAKNAYIMIHNPAAYGGGGEAGDLRRTANLLDSIRAGMLSEYVSKSKQDEATVSRMMDEETWMDAKTAVELGFADSIADKANASAYSGQFKEFDLAAKFQHIPANLIAGMSPKVNRGTAPQREESDMDAAELKAAMAESNKPIIDALGALATAISALPKAETKPEPKADDGAANAKLVADIMATCKLAGFPEAASDYLDKDGKATKTIEEVRTDLAAKQSKGRTRANTSNLSTVPAAGGDGADEDHADLVPKPKSHSEVWARFNAQGRGRSAPRH
jgi:ATP-dependent protease ClpP protease subunit